MYNKEAPEIHNFVQRNLFIFSQFVVFEVESQSSVEQQTDFLVTARLMASLYDNNYLNINTKNTNIIHYKQIFIEKSFVKNLLVLFIENTESLKKVESK